MKEARESMIRPVGHSFGLRVAALLVVPFSIAAQTDTVPVYRWGGRVSIGDDIGTVSAAVTELHYPAFSCSRPFNAPPKDNPTACLTRSENGSVLQATFDKDNRLIVLFASDDDPERRLYHHNKDVFTNWWGKPSAGRGRNKTNLSWLMQDGSSLTIGWVEGRSFLAVNRGRPRN